VSRFRIEWVTLDLSYLVRDFPIRRFMLILSLQSIFRSNFAVSRRKSDSQLMMAPPALDCLRSGTHRLSENVFRDERTEQDEAPDVLHTHTIDLH
jgi:hypothetical protein